MDHHPLLEEDLVPQVMRWDEWIELAHEGLHQLHDLQPSHLRVLSQSLWDEFDLQNKDNGYNHGVSDGLMAKSLFHHPRDESCSGSLFLDGCDGDLLPSGSSRSLTTTNDETSSSMTKPCPPNSMRSKYEDIGSILECSDSIDELAIMAMPTRRRGVKRKRTSTSLRGDVKEDQSKPVVFPFSVLKPSDIQGDTTLRDINRRIHMVSSSRQSNDVMEAARASNCLSPSYGKYVLNITRIHTEGQGSITIMKTRN